LQRILVVDDEPLLRQILDDVLTYAGYAVETAADGQEALEAVAAHVPDLIVSDVMMPRLSGWQLLERLHTTRPTLPVILISAVGPDISGRHEPLADHVVFLTKPFALEDLLALVRLLLDHPMA
jgi:CheY-like chemotaxis protein